MKVSKNPKVVVAACMVVTLLAGLSGAGAGAAQAGVFRSDQYPTTVTTNQTPVHTWKLGYLSISCSGPKVDGDLPYPSSSLTFTVNFASCKINSTSVSADFSPCDFRAYLGATKPGTNKFETSLELNCGTKWITFKWGTCEVQVPSQYPVAPALTSNTGGFVYYEQYGMAMEVATSESLKYKIIGTGLMCPSLINGTHLDGKYTGYYQFFGETLTGLPARVYGTHY